MSTNTTENDAPSNLMELLHEVQPLLKDMPGSTALSTVVRKYHFWPALQVKKFFHDPHLVLLHNTYRRGDVAHFQTLYNECRSVVLDMSVPEDQQVIVTYAQSIPERMTLEQYVTMSSPEDACEISFEGTVITVYCYQGKWFFGTSSCPGVDSSRYFHPTKTHGDMLDEALTKLFGLEGETVPRDELRAKFTSLLDVEKAYAFLLVHYQNRHIMDYTEEFGPEYAKIVHIYTRDRGNLNEVNFQDEALSHQGVLYPKKIRFDEVAEVVPTVYAVLVTRADGTRIKVSQSSIVRREEFDLGHPNVWQNILAVYLLNRPDYRIENYISEFCPDLSLPDDPMNPEGAKISAKYLIHTVVCNMRDVLYQAYCHTTTYYPAIGRFRMNKQLDGTYSPMLRFHLAQLRHLQVQDHRHAYLNAKAIYDYLCFHQTIKNIKGLIAHLAENKDTYFNKKIGTCFTVLTQLLKND